MDKGEIMWFTILKQLSPNPQNLVDLATFIENIPVGEIIQKKHLIVPHDRYGIPEDEAQVLDSALIKAYLSTENNTVRSHRAATAEVDPPQSRQYHVKIVKRLTSHTQYHVNPLQRKFSGRALDLGDEVVEETTITSSINLFRITPSGTQPLIELLLKADNDEPFDEWDRILGK